MSDDLYEVAVIGGGPVGCASALAFAERGARVLVLEANPRAAERLAGEWLHPLGTDVLAELGVELRTNDYPNGKGFVVLPDDGSEPILLPYAEGRTGVSLPHHRLVAELRRKLSTQRSIEYRESARVTAVNGDRVEFKSAGAATRGLRAKTIVGATGRSGAVHRALGVSGQGVICSRMVGVLLRDAELPFEGYGHLCLGGLGPILAYRISPREIRVCLDVPLSFADAGERTAVLYDAYAPALPKCLVEPFQRALATGEISFASNHTRNRGNYGRPGCALVGDAVGHHHPLTAVGLTLGFGDALALARAASFDDYRRERDRATRVPEILAIALYDIFTGATDETREARRAVYALFRASASERQRTMALLGCDDTSFAHFASSFTRVLGIATKGLAARGIRSGRYRDAIELTLGLGVCAKDWLAAGALHLREAEPKRESNGHSVSRDFARVSNGDGEPRPHLASAQRSKPEPDESSRALSLAIRALVAQQDDDGSWEGEVIWCAMLAAEYVLAFHIMGIALPEARKKRLLLQFAQTRLPCGLWGLAQIGEASLFVTTLVYVAARVLGVPAEDPLLDAARAFFAREGSVVAIPTWGKFWLALLSLYEWKGVNPVVPELWALPNAVPIHPGRYYCHTRLIYLAMATLYAERFQAEVTPLTKALRSELFPDGYERVNFARARNALRKDDLFAPPSPVLRSTYELLRLVDRVRSRKARAPLLAELRNAIRWELSASSHTSISPVSGLLNILALWSENPDDPDVQQAIAHFDCWVWEDDRDGVRVTGARTAVWDTSFAIQALRRAGAGAKVEAAIEKADQFLAAQQIKRSFPGYADHHRLDPRGGYSLSWGWHSWAVSDCTAEAIVARLEAGVGDGPSDEDVAMAAEFILRTQGPDGGFGSYEQRRVPFSLEWLNPAEMFGDSMTESEYVECTASCVAALARIAQERPHLLRGPELAAVPQALERGVAQLRRQQRRDGAWPGAWGVCFIYGTMFGVRGLLAAGAAPTDPAIRKACAWLKAHQRADGSWGEQHAPHASEYVAHEEGQIIQTAWALLALVEASDPEFAALERAARFLSRAQLGNGEWPRQDPVGLFFRTARLEYTLYRSYFPLWALALYEQRRRARAPLLAAAPVATKGELKHVHSQSA
jgi:lanosterol synthase